MKLGLSLPNHMPYRLDAFKLLEWAQLADQARFDVLATLDRPNYDGWDPLATLAGVATITRQIKLCTAVLQLPNRNEVNVAKQAAVVDQLSNGRLVLGLGIGSRPDDYDVFGANFKDRGARFARQIERIRDIWSGAAQADEHQGALGPGPKRPGRGTIWIGATTDRAIKRAVSIGDGLMLSGTKELLDRLGQEVATARSLARAGGRDSFVISRILYVAVGTDSAIRAQATQNLRRFYDRWAWAPVDTMIHIGSAREIAEVVARHADAGLDLLILIPELLDLRQVEILAEEVLPQYL